MVAACGLVVDNLSTLVYRRGNMPFCRSEEARGLARKYKYISYLPQQNCEGFLLKESLASQIPSKSEFENSIMVGDSRDVLKRFADGSVDLIVTSPPYADSRKHTYGGISPDRYVGWFLERSEEFFRVLNPAGSFVLNIKEKVVEGERHTYVLELILGLRRQGWLWTEEYMWHKRNCYPGKWPNRFRDAWERCLHFTKSKKFNMYQESVMVPMGDWKRSRMQNLSARDRTRDESRVLSGFGKKIENWTGRDMAYPTNVLHLATECGNKSHSAAFPEALPSWFIQLFTKAGDTVLDPFMGSGTTAVAAVKLGRKFVGVDILPEYAELARRKIAEVRLPKGVAKSVGLPLSLATK
jgi:DNA modification methylase